MAVAADAETTNLTAGAKLTPTGYISSPSGTFAFGFRALDSDPTKFLLATWFRSGNGDSSPAPPQSVVWFAKQSPSGATPLATARSALSVTSEGALVLADDGRLLWNASSTKQQQAGSVVLALADSGNVRLVTNDGTTVWESFWYPTDTLLPGQSLTLDDRSQGKLFSKRADADYTDPQHGDSGCTPSFQQQSCGGKESKNNNNSDNEFALVELQNVTWDISMSFKKLSWVTEDQCPWPPPLSNDRRGRGARRRGSPSPAGWSISTTGAAGRSFTATSSRTTSCLTAAASRGSPTSASPSCWGATRCMPPSPT
ncbi:hypothetical protein PR202_gb20502 [Eleusine coracana subsp. coracana]|uniref:non-specific serine/threonine protein kinase n=1 Tax=Eleusine coracana subsp. coracana TaxID=191504 RepID=A0AAV5FBL2_ELECO|nr:hypothetical protein PR202_gb20502 [Eleusine coracana subsp. coracana]